MTKLKLTIEGMHCASCASNVERVLKKVRGVKEVSVSLMTNKCFVESENANKEEIKRAVEKVGYKVVGIEE
jgi:P-type Cu+ transporter